ncbi:conjugative transposon protein TraM [Flavobacterium sp. FlaQc-48]|uniref:conjugative transposon protein TraM n=1 Tax=Flavobacterium sp. FlaQc-48 TaxID=3374181 RepID=UPI003757D78B
MKKNETSVSILTDDGSQSKASRLPDEKKGVIERIKKPLIFTLMGVVCMGCLYLIFKPSASKKQILEIGLNDSVPAPSAALLQADKQKAYEQELLQEKEEQKRSTLTTLSDYWNGDNSADPQKEVLPEEEQVSSQGPGNAAVNSYRNAQSTLGNFYRDDSGQTQQLRRELEELREKLAQKEIPAAVTVDDQLALMEKSYQMAAKYLPSAASAGDTGKNNTAAPVATTVTKTPIFAAFIPEIKSSVSSLHREPADSSFSDPLSPANRSFYTAGSQQQAVMPKNSVRACVQQTQTITGEGVVRLRLLESAQIPGHTIAKGTILSASAKIQTGRLQLKVTSVEVDGNIIAVDLGIYDLDGQLGLSVPYSAQMNALSEMAGNMAQQSGTSLMMTQSAGQQIAADLSRGVVQGVSGYFSKKVRAQKVTLKAGHQVFLVSKK